MGGKTNIEREKTRAWADIRLCYYLTIGGCKETGRGLATVHTNWAIKYSPASDWSLHPNTGLLLVQNWQKCLSKQCPQSLSVNSLFWDEL